MAEKPPAFTVTDRRKFTSDGDLREGFTPAEAREEEPRAPEVLEPLAEAGAEPHQAGASNVVTMPFRPGVEPEVEEALPDEEPDEVELDELAGGDVDGDGPQSEYDVEPEAVGGEAIPPGPSMEQREAAASAYERTARDLERAMAQANPGMKGTGKIGFQQVVQSFYLSAYVALGGATEPGQQARVDILGARDAIDMLAVLEEKTRGHLSPEEINLMTTALFELRMMFLEITNALAAQAHRIHTPPPGGGRK